MTKFSGTGSRTRLITVVAHRYKLLPLDDICRALEWVSIDTCVTVGGGFFEQIGTTCSLILARVYLGSSQPRLFRSLRSIPELGEVVRSLGGNVGSWLQAICHADDSLWFSRALCSGCIFMLAQAVWRRDAGVTLEGEGPERSFFHCEVFRRKGLPGAAPLCQCCLCSR